MPEFHLNIEGAERLAVQLDAFTFAYIEAMFFTGIETDDHGDDTERGKGLGLADIAPDALAKIKADCEAFQESSIAVLLETHGEPSQHGHDYWLTRNGHGTGFWDRDYPEDVGKALTDAAHKAGEVWAYIGDDGKVYV